MSSSIPTEGNPSVQSTMELQATLNDVLNESRAPKRDLKICGVFRKIHRSYEKESLKESSSYHNCIQPFAKEDHANMKKVSDGLEVILKNCKETGSITTGQKGEIDDIKKEVFNTLEKTYDQCKKENAAISAKPLQKDDEPTKSLLNYFHNKLKHKLLEGRMAELESLEQTLVIEEEESAQKAEDVPPSIE